MRVAIGLLIALGAAITPLGAQRDARSVTPKSLPRPNASVRVSALPATAIPKRFSGKCPATITFHSVVRANKYPVTVEYQWERSDGASGAKQTMTLDGEGSVQESWQLGGAGEHLAIWERVHVLSPNVMSSGPAHVRVVCEK
jgi:hypothetical protein